MHFPTAATLLRRSRAAPSRDESTLEAAPHVVIRRARNLCVHRGVELPIQRGQTLRDCHVVSAYQCHLYRGPRQRLESGFEG